MQTDNSNDAKSIDNLKWENLKPLKDIGSIDVFGGKFGIKLPSDFLHLAPILSGSTPSKRSFLTKNGKEHIIDYFLSFNPEDTNGIFKTTSRMQRGGFPENIVPIAQDPFGNLICLKTFVDKTQVVYWDHEEDIFEEISDSFIQFLTDLS